MGCRRVSIIFVPHAAGRIFKITIPVSVFQLMFVTLLVVWLASIASINEYRATLQRAAEVDKLKAITQYQGAQIQELATNTQLLADRIYALRDLDNDLRRLVGKDLPNRSERSAQAARSVSMQQEPERPSTALSDILKLQADLKVLEQDFVQTEQNLRNLKEDLIARNRYLAAVPSGWPVKGVITSGFGHRRNPFGFGSEFHEGVDIAVKYGTLVSSTGSGVVVFAGWKGSYGKTVVIDHGYGYVTYYAHNSKLLVSAGQEVKRGDAIAIVGSTGRTTGSHLHYEVHKDGMAVDPITYMNAQ